jgi:hypothetical protein
VPGGEEEGEGTEDEDEGERGQKEDYEEGVL